MSQGDATPATQPTKKKPVIWRINSAVNGVALLGTGAAFCLMVALFVGSLAGWTDDRHGYQGIFGFLGGLVLVMLLIPLTCAAVTLWRRRRSGFVFQALAGVLTVALGLPLPFTYGGWVLLTLGGALLASALVGVGMTRRRGRGARPARDRPAA